MKAIANKEAKVRRLTTEKRAPPQMVIAHFPGLALFPQYFSTLVLSFIPTYFGTGHPNQADQNCRGASGDRKTHNNNNIQQVEGSRETQRTAVLFMYTTSPFWMIVTSILLYQTW